MSASTFRFPPPQVTDPDQMGALYDGLRLVADVMQGLLCQRRYGDGLYNPAGEYLDAIMEAVCRASDDLADAAKAIQPDESADDFSDVFAARAHILVLHKINCEGITAAANLAIELFGEEASS